MSMINVLKYKILKELGFSFIRRAFKIHNGPVFVSLFFTRKCNCNCYYCATSKNNIKPDISLKRWKNIVTQLYNQGCRFITIYGGEPTLRSDLGELIKHCIDLKIYTHIVTNGILLNEDLLKEFVSYGYLVLGLSIDTFSETDIIPKKYRPELIELLHRIKEKYPENIDYTIHIIITQENKNELIPLIKAINNKLECRFSIDPVHSSLNPDEQYRYRSFCPELMLKKEDISSLRKIIQNLKRQNIKVWSPNVYYYYMNKWYQKKYNWKCDAGDLYYSINNDGTVMLCEDVETPIQFEKFIKLSHRKRLKLIKKYMLEYCICFKPCYWNPSYFVKHPFGNLISSFVLK